MNLQFVGDGGLRVVHLSEGVNSGGHITASTVQFLYRLEVSAKLSRISILCSLVIHEWLLFLRPEHRPARPRDLRDSVPPTGVDRDVDVEYAFLGTCFAE